MEPTPLHGLYVHTFMRETEKESKADQETDSGRETEGMRKRKKIFKLFCFIYLNHSCFITFKHDTISKL